MNDKIVVQVGQGVMKVKGVSAVELPHLFEMDAPAAGLPLHLFPFYRNCDRECEQCIPSTRHDGSHLPQRSVRT